MPILRCEFYVINGEHLDFCCVWTCGWQRNMNAWTKSTANHLPHQSCSGIPQPASGRHVCCRGLFMQVWCWGIPVTITGAATGIDGLQELFLSALQEELEENPNPSFSTQLVSSLIAASKLKMANTDPWRLKSLISLKLVQGFRRTSCGQR